jgi:hypothetical protein
MRLIIHEEWSGIKTKAHKEIKGLKTQNLRDHMTEAEPDSQPVPSGPSLRFFTTKRLDIAIMAYGVDLPQFNAP